jgi:putative methionine-R-sulfoxide reductase with GAF domain
LVLDVDSDRLDDFSETDAAGLGRIMRVVERLVG